MKTLLDNPTAQAMHPALGLLAVLLVVVMLSGCEAPSGAPGAAPGGGMRPGAKAGLSGRPGGAAPGGAPGLGHPGKAPATASGGGIIVKDPIVANKPNPAEPSRHGTSAANEVVNPLAPTANVEQAGNTVELASLVIVSKSNPFLDWLPKPLLPEAAPVLPGEPAVPTVSVDPFAEVSLKGIISNGTSPIALIGLGTEQSQFVRKGGVVNLATGPAKVTAIRSDALELVLQDGSKESRTLTLPSIIGYTSAGNAGASGEGNAAAAAQKMMPSGGPASSSSMVPGNAANAMPKGPLGNLQKLIEQSEAGKKPNKDALVGLKEP